MTRYQPTRHLPVVFQALDIEEKTRPTPVLICPVRGDVMTVGGCGRCQEFRRIEFTWSGEPVLCCSAMERCANDDVERVQTMIRVPALCTAPDTTLEIVLQHAELAPHEDPIPVLDWDCRPLGFVTLRELIELQRAGIPPAATLSEVMSHQVVCVLPETTLTDACELLAETQSPQLFVVGADGGFLGLFTAKDIARPLAPKGYA